MTARSVFLLQLGTISVYTFPLHLKMPKTIVLPRAPRDEQQEKLTRISENRHGKDELNFLGYNPQTHRFDIFYREPYYPENDAWGDSDDAFNVSYNPLFTPWSNPSNANGNNMLFSLYVSGVNGNSVAVKLDFSDASSHIPFRPINFVAAEQSGHPRLEWDENEEPDLDYYEVWKKVNTGSYALLAVTTNTYYVDTSEDIINQPETNSKDIFYKARAVDITGKKSLYTLSVQYLVSGDPLWSRDGSKNFQALKLDDFALETNHPNPFNPTTHISYALPEASAVTLEVFDVSGRKVSVLVKKSQEQGWHYATFDGGTLPSGIYIYRISATGMESGKRFTQAKRMLLVK